MDNSTTMKAAAIAFAAALVSASLTLAACDGRSPTVPTVTAPTPTGIVIAGLESDLKVGQVLQLSALISLSSGDQKALAGEVSWQTSNVAVASVSRAGVLTITGIGEADVTAGFQGLTGLGHLLVSGSPQSISPPLSYDISGVVHESAPSQDVLVADVRVEVVGGPLDGLSFETDPSGRFTLAAIVAPGFALKFKKHGYDDKHLAIVALPRDQYLDVALNPADRCVYSVNPKTQHLGDRNLTSFEIVTNSLTCPWAVTYRVYPYTPPIDPPVIFYSATTGVGNGRVLFVPFNYYLSTQYSRWEFVFEVAGRDGARAYHTVFMPSR